MVIGVLIGLSERIRKKMMDVASFSLVRHYFCLSFLLILICDVLFLYYILCWNEPHQIIGENILEKYKINSTHRDATLLLPKYNGAKIIVTNN